MDNSHKANFPQMARFLTEFLSQSNSQRFNLAKVGMKAVVPLSLQVRESIIYQVMYSREDEAETNRWADR